MTVKLSSLQDIPSVKLLFHREFDQILENNEHGALWLGVKLKSQLIKLDKIFGTYYPVRTGLAAIWKPLVGTYRHTHTRIHAHVQNTLDILRSCAPFNANDCMLANEMKGTKGRREKVERMQDDQTDTAMVAVMKSEIRLPILVQLSIPNSTNQHYQRQPCSYCTSSLNDTCFGSRCLSVCLPPA